jgi:hypothetical protein
MIEIEIPIIKKILREKVILMKKLYSLDDLF